MLKKKSSKDTDGTNTSGKSEQTDVVEQADENPCDILTVQSGKRKYLDAWLLDSGCKYIICAQKENGSANTSLSMRLSPDG